MNLDQPGIVISICIAKPSYEACKLLCKISVRRSSQIKHIKRCSSNRLGVTPGRMWYKMSSVVKALIASARYCTVVCCPTFLKVRSGIDGEISDVWMNYE